MPPPRSRRPVRPRAISRRYSRWRRGSLDIPARYVSGYRLAEGEHQPTPHGWAEAHVAGLGWVAFDPSTGQCPEEDHVRVAVALDAAGAAPVAGSRLGVGAEILDVDVVVSLEA